MLPQTRCSLNNIVLAKLPIRFEKSFVCKKIEPTGYTFFLHVRIGYTPAERTQYNMVFTLSLVTNTLCVCVFSSHPFWTSSSLDVPAGVTQEEGHTGFLIHLPSAVRALIFVARRIQPFLSLVDREVEFCVLTN